MSIEMRKGVAGSVLHGIYKGGQFYDLRSQKPYDVNGGCLTLFNTAAKTRVLWSGVVDSSTQADLQTLVAQENSVGIAADLILPKDLIAYKNIFTDGDFDTAVVNAGEKMILAYLYVGSRDKKNTLPAAARAVADKYRKNLQVLRVNLDSCPELVMALQPGQAPQYVILQGRSCFPFISGNAPQETLETLLANAFEKTHLGVKNPFSPETSVDKKAPKP